MSDENKIILSDRDAALFEAALANPPAPNKALKALFSSKKDDWETPDDFFQAMVTLFGKFDFDAAASIANHKCEVFLSPELDYNALEMNWVKDVVSRPNNGQEILAWLNPPYGRGVTGKWVEKAYQESLKGVKTVLLLPARTDTKWYRTCHEHASEIYFIQGRLKFKGAKDSAPFPSMVVVFSRNHQFAERRISLMNTKGQVIKL